MATSNRIIFHVDIDAFYPSVEARENPSLRGLPLVIGADPEKGKGRGVVVACSYEARRYGLRSGMPISRAYKLCPQAVYIRPNFALYENASSTIMRVLQHYADGFEQVGIDEAFLDVSSRVQNLEDARTLALAIKQELRDSAKLTCSVGVAPNKSAAKIASDREKPDGLTLVPLGKVEEFLAPLPVHVIPGVGKKTTAFLDSKGIKTVAELQQIPGPDLVKWFGKGGVWLWGVIHGKEEILVKPRETPRSMNVERTFRQDVHDFGVIEREAEALSDELSRRLKLGNLLFRTAGIKIRFRGFETYTREKSYIEFSNDQGLLKKNTNLLLSEFRDKSKPVRLVGVRVSQLKFAESGSPSLDLWAS
jgi:DNA polymerase IV (DinB-like DNA polymerase)